MKQYRFIARILLVFCLNFSLGFAAASQPHDLSSPKVVQSALQQWLNHGLGIAQFDAWLFKSNALYGASGIWWHSKTHFKRQFPHEGVDFYFYQVKDTDKLMHVKEGTPIPLIYPGKLVTIFNDFIGQSVLFSTDQYREINHIKYQFYILYSHVAVAKGLEDKVGQEFPAASLLFAYNYQRKNFAPPHLHLTVFWANRQFDATHASWEILDTSTNVILVNPLLNDLARV